MTYEAWRLSGVPIGENDRAALMADSALEWLAERTDLDTQNVEALPACARLFILKATEMPLGVRSQSMEGISVTFETEALERLAESLLRHHMKGGAHVLPAQGRWTDAP